MKKKIMTAAGLILTAFMLWFSLINNFNIGILIPMIIGVIIAVWCYLPDNNVIKQLKRLFIFFTGILVVFMIFVGVMAQTNSAEFDEDAVIVLGCGLHGTVPSGNLADRLNKAVEYNSKNPDAVIVVSGGQGPQEECTEAEAMYKYLVEKGVSDDVIIQESKATSTNENYRFSKEILDDILGEDYEVVYITNSFHSYRAGELAKLNGLNAKAYNARTKFSSLIPNYCREVFAVIQLWVFGR
ncbi:MAG: YdcF family protein [Clostridia bacterium]|nr:YdcF family protein [Clostridia bacterium]